jgi:hypothetical protein
MATRPYNTFPPPSLKFRTVGFPQYGFKREVHGNLRASVARSNLYAVQVRPSDPLWRHCQLKLEQRVSCSVRDVKSDNLSVDGRLV